jgi:hypothetical protein
MEVKLHAFHATAGVSIGCAPEQLLAKRRANSFRELNPGCLARRKSLYWQKYPDKIYLMLFALCRLLNVYTWLRTDSTGRSALRISVED